MHFNRLRIEEAGRWKFRREVTHTPIDGCVVRYRIKSRYYTGEIVASANGVSIGGTWPKFRNPLDIADVQQIWDKAMRQYIHLWENPDARPLEEKDESSV